MTEEEKRKALLDFMAAEQRRSPLSFNQDRINNIMHRTARQRELYASLARQGITWQQLKQAYDEEYAKGQSEMIRFRLSFFYGSLAVAFHEWFSSPSEQTSAFLHQVEKTINGEDSKESIVRRCLAETGVDVSGFDVPPQTAKSTRKDRAAVERMRKTGITEKDLEDEKRIGYQHGWNREFYHSVCYAAAALCLHAEHELAPGDIESFIERIEEICDEEISAVEIIERAKREAGIDVDPFLKAAGQT